MIPYVNGIYFMLTHDELESFREKVLQLSLSGKVRKQVSVVHQLYYCHKISLGRYLVAEWCQIRDSLVIYAKQVGKWAIFKVLATRSRI